jgi:hypothetical protein
MTSKVDNDCLHCRGPLRVACEHIHIVTEETSMSFPEEIVVRSAFLDHLQG